MSELRIKAFKEFAKERLGEYEIAPRSMYAAKLELAYEEMCQEFSTAEYRLNYKIKTMEAALAEARKGLEFYGDEEAWSEADCQRCPAMLLGEDIENRNDNKDRFTGGKIARITLSTMDAILSDDERKEEV